MSADPELIKIRDNFKLDASNPVPDRAINDLNEVRTLLKQSQQNITIAAQNREELQQTDKFVDLDDKFKFIINLQTELNNQEKAFAKLKADTISKNIKNPSELYKKYKNDLLRETAKKPDAYLESREYKDFRQSIWNINHHDEIMPSLSNNNEDDDLVVGPSKISLKCPITTTWLEDPVTSNVCNHTFSKAAIFGLLNGGGFVSCPIPGCVKTVTKSNLVTDILMADRVTRAKAKEREAHNQQFFDV